jgi:hypothetical protein
MYVMHDTKWHNFIGNANVKCCKKSEADIVSMWWDKGSLQGACRVWVGCIQRVGFREGEKKANNVEIENL